MSHTKERGLNNKADSDLKHKSICLFHKYSFTSADHLKMTDFF